MARRPSFAGRGWTIVGLVFAGAHIVLLASVALFDEGRLAEDWVETVLWLLLALMPAALAAVGLRNPGALVAAALVSLPLSLISLAGATLPLIIPALCYGAGYATSADAPT